MSAVETHPQSVIDATATALAVPFDALSARHDPARGVAVQSEDHLLDVYISQQTPHWTAELTTSELMRPYLWKGLLRHQYGTVDVDLSPDNQTTARHIEFRIMSSPQAINQVQRALGRTPGTNAFQLVRNPEKTYFTAGEWIEGFAGYTVPVSDTSDWTLADHDTNPSDHVQSWILTPPTVSKQIADHASSMSQKYGDKIHEIGSNCPASVVEFARALDDLAEYTRPIFKMFQEASKNPASASLTPKNINQRLEDIDTRRSSRTWSWLFASLGVIQYSWPERRNVRRIREITNQYGVHAANLLLNLETITPPTEDESAVNSRIDLWHRTIKAFESEQ